jgi:hypothetical protein
VSGCTLPPTTTTTTDPHPVRTLCAKAETFEAKTNTGLTVAVSVGLLVAFLRETRAGNKKSPEIKKHAGMGVQNVSYTPVLHVRVQETPLYLATDSTGVAARLGANGTLRLGGPASFLLAAHGGRGAGVDGSILLLLWWWWKRKARHGDDGCGGEYALYRRRG